MVLTSIHYHLPWQIEDAYSEVCVKSGQSILSQAEGRNEEKEYKEWTKGLVVSYPRKHQEKYT